MSDQPSPELVAALAAEAPGQALDLACGAGRHASWLAARGWTVTATDLVPVTLPGVKFITADIARDGFPIQPEAWDLIICWLYWQPNLLARIAAGVRPGGLLTLAGKTTGRFATSLANYRDAFPGWLEVAAGESDGRVHFIARRSS